MSQVVIADDITRTATLKTDQHGMIVERDEVDGLSGGDPRTLRYFYGGIQMGLVTNNGTDDMHYAAAVADRLRTLRGDDIGGAFRGGSKTSRPHADFEQSYDAINGASHAGVGSSYTVASGETLTDIALQLWGDASLWYVIASANGLTGAEALAAGQLLHIPARVHNSRNAADTFRVYDPNEAIGNTFPAAVKPPKKPPCGVFGQILLVAVAVAVAAIVAPWATGIIVGQAAAGSATAIAGGIAGAAIGGAAGSVASQAIGVRTGLQQKFSWKGVAIAGISAGITAGITQFAALSQIGSAGPSAARIGGTMGRIGRALGGQGFFAGAARGALGNALTQGIGVATGLQDRFSYGAVAGAALGAGISSEIARSGVFPQFDPANPTPGALAAHIGAGLFGGWFNAGARTIVDGTSFGDNILAALPDVIGATIGNLVAGSLASRAAPSARAEAEAAQDEQGGGTVNTTSLDRALAAAMPRLDLDLGLPRMLTFDTPFGPSTAAAELASLAPATSAQQRAVEAVRRAMEPAPTRLEDISNPHRNQVTDGEKWLNAGPVDYTPFLIDPEIDPEYRLRIAYLNYVRPDSPRADQAGSLADVLLRENMYNPYRLEDLTSRLEGALANHPEYADRLAPHVALLRDVVDESRALATREVDAPILLFMGSNMLGGGGGAAVRFLAPMVGFGRLGTTGLTVAGDGLVGGTAAIPMRAALGEEISLRTFMQDTALSAVGSIIVRTAARGFERVATGPTTAVELRPAPAVARSQIELNRAAGEAFQLRAEALGADSWEIFAREVSIRPNTATGPASFRFRIDGMGANRNSEDFGLLEAKASETARLTRNQAAGFPLVEEYGGIIVGNNGGMLLPSGTIIPPRTQVMIIRPSNLPDGY